MASFNQIILLGNLTRDPEMRYLPNNTPVVQFGMACNRKFRDAQGQDREEVMFIDCSAFGKQAEIINQYCHKGELLFVQGRLKLDTWEDKQGGGKRSKHQVVVENFQLMPRRGGGEPMGGGEGMEGGQSAPRRAPMRPASRPAPQQQQQAPDQSPIDDQQQFKEDDIPF
jgi:single-strand DNA-binding protein